jgi:hypothetical protein
MGSFILVKTAKIDQKIIIITFSPELLGLITGEGLFDAEKLTESTAIRPLEDCFRDQYSGLNS